MFFEKLAGVGALRARLAQHVIFKLGELGLPLLVGLLYSIVHFVPFVA